MASREDPELENPTYAALEGPHASMALVNGRVRRYPFEVAPFLGLPAEPSDEDWRDAGEFLRDGQYAAVLLGEDELPGMVRVAQVYDLVQMTGERATAAPFPQAISLGHEDVPEMLALVARTEPGPFLARTVELGRYLGTRDHSGALVAMAGERLCLERWTEISAVCTSPEQRGHGLASRLVEALVTGIRERGREPFLHVLASNVSAIRLYEALGFQITKTARISVVTATPLSASAA